MSVVDTLLNSELFGLCDNHDRHFLPRIPDRTGYKNLLGYDDVAVCQRDGLLDFKHLINVTIVAVKKSLCFFFGDLFYRSVYFAFRKVLHSYAFYPVKPIGQLFV